MSSSPISLPLTQLRLYLSVRVSISVLSLLICSVSSNLYLLFIQHVTPRLLSVFHAVSGSPHPLSVSVSKTYISKNMTRTLIIFCL